MLCPPCPPCPQPTRRQATISEVIQGSETAALQTQLKRLMVGEMRWGAGGRGAGNPGWGGTEGTER